MPAVTPKRERERPTVPGDERIGRGPGYLHGYRPAVTLKDGTVVSRPSKHKPSVLPRRLTKRGLANKT